MANVTVTSNEVRAITSHGAVVVPGVAGGTITIGYAVYQGSDGRWVHADANVSLAAATVMGIAVESFDGEDTVAEGNALSICIQGPVGGFDITPGALYYLSDDVGRVADAPGAHDRILGVGMQIAGFDVLNVNVQLTDASS